MADAPAPPALEPTASIAALTRALCDIDSVSGNETRLADAIEAALRSASHLEVVRDGDAIVARTTPGRARRVIVAGHIDTVAINDNLPVREVDGFLIGRGTVDMKGGIAVALKLALELTAPSVDVTWIFYDHEEVASELNGLGRLARHRPDLMMGDFAILCEPTSATVEGGCNGTARVEIRTHGRRAHSARSWVGVNAIHALSPVLEILAAYEPQSVEVDGLIYREGLNAVGIAGGVAGNVIPDEAVVTVNYRFAPSRTAADAIEHLERVFDGYEVVVTDIEEGARPGMDAPLAQEFLAAVGGVAHPKYGWTDVARFARLGIPAVNYGPGNALLAHADDEAVAIAELEQCEQGLRAWLSAP